MRHPQKRKELDQFLDIARGCRSYLEIGAKHGLTTIEVAHAMPRGTRIVVVDLPGGAWGGGKTRTELEAVVLTLQSEGYDVRLFLGDSHDAEIIRSVCDLGPFDLILIDADHRYEGVKADWKNYGSMGKAIAFHDINADEHDNGVDGLMAVKTLWNEIKQDHRNVVEFIDTEGVQMGIGIVWP